MEVTVLTPTYNRGENLRKLYQTLVDQSNKDFEWVLIDDGSEDNTEEIVKQFINENKVSIRYYKKANGGKHRALNMGIEKINTDLTFIVDSDDWIENNAIEKINYYHKKYKNENTICGYSFLRRNTKGTINGKVLKENEVIDDYINIRINRKDTNSDKAEVWKTKCLKEYPFPEFDGEKFLGEDVVWIQMSLKYKMVFLKDVISISEYLDEGLTKNRRKHNIESPNGCYYRAKIANKACSTRKVDFIYSIKCLLQLQIYGKFAGKKLSEEYNACNSKYLFWILYPISIILYNKWKKNSKVI